MKKLFFIILVLFTINFAHANSGRAVWQKANDKGKSEIIKIYQDWFLNASENENISEWDIKITSMFSIFNEAWAADVMDCIYAGWPSRRIGSCSSPLRSNADYKQGACRKSEMQCQPLLFGEGLCVSVDTSESRNIAFFNCNKKFQMAKRTSAAVVSEIKGKNEETQLLSLLDFADGICKTSAQAQTGMCIRLRERLASVRSALAEVVTTLAGIPAVVEAINPPKANCPPETPTEAPLPVALSSDVLESPAPEEISTASVTPFVQDRPRANLCNGQRSENASDNLNSGFGVLSTFPCKGEEIRINSGVAIAGADYHTIDFSSQDGSKAGTYIYLQEAVLPNDSNNVKSMMFLLPRKGIPSAVAEGSEIRVTLTTGEVVIYDRTTKEIKSGALTEGPSDKNEDRFTRRPPNVHYNGSGISIRVDHRYEHPTSSAGDPTAEVKQNGRTCSVPRAKLWDAEGSVLETDDAVVVKVLNQACPPKKGEQPFSI